MHAGMSTRLTFSPAFAPPETLCAVQEGAITTLADTASDVWAMGVIAYELSTKQPPFPVMVRLQPTILAQILVSTGFGFRCRLQNFARATRRLTRAILSAGVEARRHRGGGDG